MRTNALERGEHGTRACYDAGCRCGPCVTARRKVWTATRNAVELRRRDRVVPALVPIRRTGRHLDRLLARGWTIEKIAAEAGCSVSTLSRVLALHHRSPRVWNTIEAAVCGIDPDATLPAPLEPVRDELRARGYSSSFVRS